MNTTLEQVYELATQYAPGIMTRYNLPMNKFSAEDVVGEFIVKFMEKDFLAKFDANVTSLNHYVFAGLRNAAVSMARHVKYEMTSLDAMADEDGKALDLPAPAAVEDLLLEDVTSKFTDFEFGYGKPVVIRNGSIELGTFETKASSVVKLLAMGFTKGEIAKEFGVTASTITNVITKVREEMEISILEAYAVESEEAA